MSTIAVTRLMPGFPGKGSEVTRTLRTFARHGLAVVFLISGVAKLNRPHHFLEAVYGYELLSPATGLAVAIVLPWLEVLLGVSILSGIFERGGALGCTILLAAFTGVIASALWRRLSISCGCLDLSSASQITVGTLLRSASLLAVSAWCMRQDMGRSSPVSERQSPTEIQA
jgi:uncharacterized membrane protein YphA (DoxX/SURF4 family)